MMWNVIEECIKSPVHGWSMGSFGAIGYITDSGALALTLHEANPCRDLLGKDKPFDQYQQFQHGLQRVDRALDAAVSQDVGHG
ncbi:MAG: hypothetical protein KUG73_03285 [Pseudomonadales bacterium]|nr:hypothetical protein [Pseudomonadales bacterium]